MNKSDWAMFIIALANLTLRVWEMRKPRRNSDEADPEDHQFAFGGRVGLANRLGLTKYSR